MHKNEKIMKKNIKKNNNTVRREYIKGNRENNARTHVVKNIL